MKVRNISGVSHNPFKRLRDEVGALRKRVELSRLEPYADIIDLAFERYNTDDDSRTMMFKLLRDPERGTVTRRKHTENCKKKPRSPVKEKPSKSQLASQWRIWKSEDSRAKHFIPHLMTMTASSD